MQERSGSQFFSRFTFIENATGNLPKVLGAKFLGSHGPFCFISICKFGNFKNPFATITSLPELYFRFRRFILLVQTKKWFLFKKVISIISMLQTMEMSDVWPDTYDERIYTSIPTWTDWQNALVAAEARTLKIFSHGTSLKWSWRSYQSPQE